MTGSIRVLCAEAAVRLILIVRLPFVVVPTSLLPHGITVTSVAALIRGGWWSIVHFLLGPEVLDVGARS